MTFSWDGSFMIWLWRSSWQAAVLIGLVLLVQWLLRRQLTATWRYNLWLLVLLRLVMPVSPESTLSVFNLATIKNPSVERQGLSVPFAQSEAAFQRSQPPAAGVAPTGGQADVPGSAQSEINRAHARTVAMPMIGLAREMFPTNVHRLWALGVIFFLSRIVWQNVRFAARLPRCSRPCQSEALPVLERCQQEMKVRRPLALLETPHVKSPALYGMLRPKLLLPEGLTSTLTSSELGYVFLHELAHVKRRDMAVNWLMTALQILHWFNPIIWLAFSRIRADRELACDALALSCGKAEENRLYGETIIKLLEGLARPEPRLGLVGILETRSQIDRRIAAIARAKKDHHWPPMMCLLLLVLSLTTLTDARTPKSSPNRLSVLAGSNQQSRVNGQANRELLFQVVDASGDVPLSGSRLKVIALKNRADPGSPQELVCGPDGTAMIPLPEFSHNFLLLVEAAHEDYVTKIVDWSAFHHDIAEDVPPAYLLRLNKAVPIGGGVRDQQGEPIVGARLRITHPGARVIARTIRESINPGGDSHYEVTDEEGRWNCHHMPEQINGALFSVTHSRFREAAFRCQAEKAPTNDTTLISAQALLSSSAIMTLRPGLRVLGAIVDEEGHRISGATVTQDGAWTIPSASTLSDADGNFTFENCREGDLTLTVQADGYAPLAQTVAVTGTQSRLRLRLARGRILLGRVVDERGNAVIGARIEVAEDARHRRIIPWNTTTDGEGRFKWDSAPEGSLLCAIGAGGFLSERSHRLIPGITERRIQLKRSVINPPIRVMGTVFDEATAEPVKTFAVQLRAKRTIDDYTVGEFGDAGPSAYGKDGHFHLLVTRSALLSYAVEIEAEGYATQRTDWITPTNANQVLKFSLKKNPREITRIK